MSGERYGVTFEDAWNLWAEVEGATGARLVVNIWPPRGSKGRGFQPAAVAITATRLEGGKEKSRKEWCQIGGARGARTVPAAMVRALTELAARLEEATEDAKQLAAF